MEIFRGWRFDIRSAVITILLVPLIVFFLRIMLRHLKIWGAYILEGIMYWLARALIHSLAASFTLKRYCRLQLANVNAYLHVPSSQDFKLHIDKVYVTLTMDSPGSKGSYSHRDILNAGNRLRVIGDPGSGKSSLVKRLFRDGCEAGIRNPRKSRLPILVELKNLKIPTNIASKQLGQWFYQELRREACKASVYKMAECFDNYAETVGLLILLDGLDEVSTSDYQRVRDAIQRLSLKLGQLGSSSIVLLTMRTQFHQQVKQDFRDMFAQAMHLKAFSPSDIYDFLSRWPFEKEKEQNRSRIYKELTDRPTLREMCSNPLILSMYVAEDQAVGHVVAPETRTEFYSKVIEELLIRRRLQQTGITVATTKLKEQRERILGQLAYEHLLNKAQSANVLTWSAAMATVRKVTSCSEEDAPLIFRDLAKETGLVTEERIGQTFRFIHLTVCEFLAGYECVQGQRAGWEQLVGTQEYFQRSENPQVRTRLTEVIPFAAGLLPRIRRYDAISDVSKLRDNRLMALTFLETKLYDHPFWSVFASSERAALLDTPEQQWDQSWLRRLHLFNVVIDDANQGSRHLPIVGGPLNLQDFFQSLVAKQKSSLSTLLSAYAAQDAAAAFRLAEVCNLDLAADFPEVIVSNCDQPPFFALVKEQALKETGRIETWACIFSEAALRSRAVANIMQKMQPIHQLLPLTEAIPPRSQWFGKRVRRSFYTQMLTIAVESRYKSNDNITTFPLVDCVKTLPPPSSARLLPSWALTAVGLTTLGLLLTYADFRFSNIIRPAIVVLFFIGIYGALLWLTINGRRVGLAYSEILQTGRSLDILLRDKPERLLILRFLFLTSSLSISSFSVAERYFGKKHIPALNRIRRLRVSRPMDEDLDKR